MRANMMVAVRQFSRLFLILAALYSAGAAAYQYGYPPPYGYYAPRGYYPAYDRAPYPYYPYSQPRPHAAPPNRALQAPTVEAGYGRTGAAPSAVESPVRPETAPDTGSGLSPKKRDFIETLLPAIEEENRRIASLRSRLTGVMDRLDSGAPVSADARKQLADLARKYRVDGDPLQQAGARAELMRKIDIIPVSLALAQAANESAWGESRFAREANNLFGIWTYDESKGLKPLRREEGKKHLVRIFEDVGESVRYYMYTLNSHPAYGELRAIREQLRQASSDIDGYRLAGGLEKYSAKGEAYVELIQGLIEQHEWALLDADNQRA